MAAVIYREPRQMVLFRLKRTRPILVFLTPKRIKDFWAKVSIASEDECWPFESVACDGYARFAVDGRPMLSHRVAYVIANGFDPLDWAVCHSCDNPPCCNPKHLWLGTEENRTSKLAR
jgi:hypothetical protein